MQLLKLHLAHFLGPFLNGLHQPECTQPQPQAAKLNAKEMLALTHVVKSWGVLDGDLESSGGDLLPLFPREPQGMSPAGKALSRSPVEGLLDSLASACNL